ncbi:hypothetical protein BZG35_05170 [Brevundimonas sp. LM2]|uniref:DUF6445 family protein n=1 Tax=Brevundimonas sp. LM2 TaxID=1938605 RepID=UPI0009839AF4|nr:DUF6445 family protein [Brevundimonas sp. LM2]AQR63357.1 hypothetical protein BZG35_05170 [Brevundimonas sp. LM2]
MIASSAALAGARLEHIGTEREPLLILDDVVASPEGLIRVAAEDAAFDAPVAGENFYPGRLAPAPLDYVGGLARALDPLIREGFGLARVNLGRASCNFSIVTLDPDRLSLAQRLPHVDTVDPLQFAILHYLCDPRLGGTAFYRHRATGYETLQPDRLVRYQATLDAELAAAAPALTYMGADTPQFARTRLVEPAFNRVIVYRSRTLHSGHIPDPTALSPDPRVGRLTANIFLTYRSTV